MANLTFFQEKAFELTLLCKYLQVCNPPDTILDTKIRPLDKTKSPYPVAIRKVVSEYNYYYERGSRSHDRRLIASCVSVGNTDQHERGTTSTYVCDRSLESFLKAYDVTAFVKAVFETRDNLSSAIDNSLAREAQRLEEERQRERDLAEQQRRSNEARAKADLESRREHLRQCGLLPQEVVPEVVPEVKEEDVPDSWETL